MIEIAKFMQAKEAINKIILRNDLSKAPYLSQISNCEIYLKKENLQHTGSFKIRGAFNKISSLSDEEKSKGIICASAGNHAQGVAFSANHFKIKSIIVMPEATPLLKVQGVKNLGAEVVLHGDNYDEAYLYANNFAKERNLTFIHPFADELVIAGQGSIALEMIEEIKDITTVVVPVGGGGLISGIASVYKQLLPNVKIIGVASSGASAMYDSFKNKKMINNKSVRTIADGIAVRDVNATTFQYILECVDDMVLVNDEEIATAILYLLEKQKLIVEGAGAASVASLLHNKFKTKPSDKIALILSGGNIDVNMLSVIIEKGLIKSNRKMKVSVTLIDKPGSLKNLSDIFSKQGANIVKIDYDRTLTNIKYGDANITISLEIKGEEHRSAVIKALNDEKYIFEEIF